MTAHVHAALMAEYAKDAAETDAPWDRWECRQARGDELYVQPDRAEWRPASDWARGCPHPSWNPDWDFRRKPQTIEVFAVVNKHGAVCNTRETRELAADVLQSYGPRTCGMRIVHMREVIE